MSASALRDVQQVLLGCEQRAKGTELVLVQDRRDTRCRRRAHSVGAWKGVSPAAAIRVCVAADVMAQDQNLRWFPKSRMVVGDSIRTCSLPNAILGDSNDSCLRRCVLQST